jgi:hypothetical protein
LGGKRCRQRSLQQQTKYFATSARDSPKPHTSNIL